MSVGSKPVNGTTCKRSKETVKNVRCGGIVTYTLTEHQFETMYRGRHGDLKLNIGIGCISFVLGLWIDYLLMSEKTAVYMGVFWSMNIVLSIIGVMAIVLHIKDRQKIDKLYSTLKNEANSI